MKWIVNWFQRKECWEVVAHEAETFFKSHLGKRILASIILKGYVGQDIFLLADGDPARMAYLAGRQSLAIELLEFLHIDLKEWINHEYPERHLEP